jgi:hypothetical protein
VPSVAMIWARWHLKLLDQDGNIGICEPLFADLIQSICYDEVNENMDLSSSYLI